MHLKYQGTLFQNSKNLKYMKYLRTKKIKENYLNNNMKSGNVWPFLYTSHFSFKSLNRVLTGDEYLRPYHTSKMGIFDKLAIRKIYWKTPVPQSLF